MFSIGKSRLAEKEVIQRFDIRARILTISGL